MNVMNEKIESVNRLTFKTRSTGTRRWGGKFNAIPLLLSYFPEPRSGLQFIDLFTGSGVVAMNYGNKQTVMNDKDAWVFNFLWVISGIKFKKRIHETTNDEIKPIWQEKIDLAKDFFLEIEETVHRGSQWAKKYKNRMDRVGRAIYYYLLNKNNFSGIIHFDRKNPFDYKLPNLSKFILYNNLVNFFRECDVRVWDLDYKKIIEKLKRVKNTDRQQVFIYADPPYPEKEGGKGYDHFFTEEETREYAKIMLNCKHHWISSEADCDLVRDIFDGNYFKRVKWAYTGARDHDTHGKTELLISNRPFKKRNLTTTIDKFLKFPIS